MRLFAVGYQPATAAEDQAERMQASVRIPAALLVSAYVIVASLVVTDGARLESWALNLLAAYAAFIAFASGLLLLIRRYPGHYPVRRGIAMLVDFSTASFSIIAGCTVMLPTYVFIVWVALGNGVRFGRHYLVIGTALAQTSLAIIFLATPHWQEDPVLPATLAVTALVVPAFAYSLLRAKERAEEATRAAVQAKSRFLAQASHDLRQPVHAMHLFLESLRQTGLSHDQQDLADRLDTSLGSVTAMFKSLLDISAIDGGGTTPKPVAVPVQKLFDDLAAQCAASDGDAPGAIDFMPTKHWVETDPMLMLTILQNIVENAIKHASGARVLVGCRLRNGTLSIEVHDQGPGIAADHLPQLFNEFYQANGGQSSSAGGGVGLGLAIVKRLAELLELKPEIRSTPGKGTVAALHGLRRVTATHPASSPAARRRTPTAPLEGLRILLVEDEPEILDVTARLLRGWGCEVEAQPTMPEPGSGWDLIVTDYDIASDINGLDVIARQRAACGRNIPAIILSAHDVDVSRYTGTGSSPLLLGKPLAPAELRSAISSLRLAA
jgi:signal transduction histidine kinase